MKLEKMNFSKKYHIMRILFLIAYLGCMLVLVVESLTPGKKSASKSNAVGSIVGGFINDLGGDQAKEINATSCLVSTKNNEHVFSVGEKVTLNVETRPENSTHKSYDYISLDESIATVSKNGIVTFLKDGDVTIKVINLEQKDIFSTIKLTSKEIEAQSLTTEIIAKYIDDETPYYELEEGLSYEIKNIIEPTNTTNKKVDYVISNTNKISISNDIIYAKNVTDDLISIDVKTSDISNTIYVKVIQKEIVIERIELESITSNDIDKYIDEKTPFNPVIKYNPTYTSSEFKGYILESENIDIVKVVDNKLVVVGMAGSALIKITSTYDSSIYTYINVFVKNRSNISDYTISYSKVMYVNQSQTIYIRNVKPNDSKVNEISYSLEGDQATITSSGVLKAIATGDISLTINVMDTNGNVISKTINISIIEKPTTIVDDFTIKYYKDNMPIVYNMETINLNSLFGIQSFYNNGNTINPDNKSYTFSFDDNVDMIGTNKASFDNGGLYNGFIVYTNTDDSIVAKEISIYVISDFDVVSDLKSSSYDLKVNSQVYLRIEDNIDEQKYNYSVNGKTIRVESNNKQFKITSIDSGKSILTITPVLGEVDLSSYKKEIEFNSTDIFTSTLKINFKDSNGKTIKYSDNYELIKGKPITYEVIIDKNATRSNVNLVCDDGFDVMYYTITPNEIGYLKLEFIEEYSKIKNTYSFKVKNYIHVDETKLYDIDGKYEIKNNSIEIINGQTVKLELVFYSDSTFKNVTYRSSDESILKVFSDGTISPQKEGNAIVTMEVNDGEELKQYNLNFSVHKKNVIDDMNSFIYYVRKGLGHFGAFLILGIFSTLAYMLFFRRRLLPIGIVINFLLGFLFAGFTEYLQTLVPGRYGAMSDILIDYSGFLVSASTITITLSIIFIIKYYKKKNSVEKLEENDLNEL